MKLPLALALTLSFVATARADLAPPGPDMLDCPSGAMGALPPIPEGATDPRGRPARPWPYCAPTTCTSDADCVGGRVCSAAEVGLCVEDHDTGMGTSVRAARDRGCEPDGTCLNLMSTCERARRCVASDGGAAPPTTVAPPPPTSEAPPPAPPPPVPAPESSGWCSVGAPSAGLPMLLAAALVLLALRRRRAALFPIQPRKP